MKVIYSLNCLDITNGEFDNVQYGITVLRKKTYIYVLEIARNISNMDEREGYLQDDDRRRTNEFYQRKGELERQKGGGGCVVILFALGGALASASYGIHQTFFC